jgi:hypothetical protein
VIAEKAYGLDYNGSITVRLQLRQGVLDGRTNPRVAALEREVPVIGARLSFNSPATTLIFRELHRELRITRLQRADLPFAEYTAMCSSAFCGSLMSASLTVSSRSANSISRFGSPSVPVSTQRLRREAIVPAFGPMTIASTRPAGALRGAVNSPDGRDNGRFHR